jgi:hypothetical protein
MKAENNWNECLVQNAESFFFLFQAFNLQMDYD